MNTSILTMVVAGALLAGQNAAPSWQENYSQAQTMGAQQQKPLLLVFGMGENGASKIVRDGNIPANANQMLSDKYVCVYVDMTTKAGKNLAQRFEITGNTGIVISDRTGAQQAFWHQGDITNENFVTVLQTYSDPNRVVRSTDTGATVRLSNYQPGGNTGGIVPVNYQQPGMAGQYPFTGGQSSYCPTCSGGSSGGRRR